MIQHSHRPRPPAAANDDAAIAVLFENAAWLDDLSAALASRRVPYAPIHVEDAAVALDDTPAWPLVFNRVSPSSYLRGNHPAIPYATAMLGLLDAHGRRVVNGGGSFRLETSKVAQHLLFRRLGVATPRSLLFNSRRCVRDAAAEFPFPAILKPNCGGSGAFVRKVESHAHLLDVLSAEEHLFAPEPLLLLQEFVAADNGAVTRLEFIDGALVYAMRVHSTNTFNLCPAESCERHQADPALDAPARVEFEPAPDVAPALVAQAREIVRAADLDVGGVELIEGDDGTNWFFDINATSVYRHDVSAALGVDPWNMLVDFLDRERHKEMAKAAHGARVATPGATLS